MTNVRDTITLCLQRLDELDPNAPVHWTRPELLVFVNDALFELNLIAWEFQGTATITIHSNANVYDYPAAILAGVTASANNKYFQRENLGDLDKEAQWEDPNRQRKNITTWSPLGLNKFVIDPKPMADTTVSIEGLVEHTPVADDSTDLPIRPEYDNAIQDYVIERAMFKEGGAELAQQGLLYKDFISTAQQMSGRNITKMHPLFTYAVVADNATREKVEQKGPQGDD